MWLKDPSLLPSNLKNSRILTYGYNAMVTAVLGKTSSDRILQHAHTLVAQLVADREVSLVGRMEPAMVTEIE
jgi:protein SERAC1